MNQIEYELLKITASSLFDTVAKILTTDYVQEQLK